MLTDTPFPRGAGVSRVTVGTFVRGHSTARYLAAVPRRILLMEQQVWSVQLAKQSILRPRVAVPCEEGDASGLGVFPRPARVHHGRL
jgi:hypothetical protein